MKGFCIVAAFAFFAVPAQANDWQKYYTPLDLVMGSTPWSGEPETLPSSGDPETDVRKMWERGYGAIGYTSFYSSNAKVSDGLKLAKKLRARYVVLGTDLESSHTSTLPLTLPTTTTSNVSGNVSVYGNHGPVSGTYSGTVTTNGSQTTYIPITVNRYAKYAQFYQGVTGGSGILGRDLNPEEMATFDTRRAFFVRAVREGSLAYNADILPGDVILRIDGAPFDKAAWRVAIDSGQPIKVGLMRRDKPRELIINPAPKPAP